MPWVYLEHLPEIEKGFAKFMFKDTLCSIDYNGKKEVGNNQHTQQKGISVCKLPLTNNLS